MQDLRDAVRALRATPLVSAVAILSLALGIGANTAMFSIVDALVLRTLPVPAADRLATIENVGTNPIWEEIRDRELFAGAFAWSPSRFNLSTSGETDYVNGIWASAGFFEVLGVRPVLGRTFVPDDDRRGGGPNGPVAVISYDYWQRRYGADPSVIGRPITVNATTLTIVGVTPSWFFGPDVGRAFDIAVPLGAEQAVRGKESFHDKRTTWWLSIMVRLKPGQSLAAGTAALRGVQPQIRLATMPQEFRAEGQARYLTDPFALKAAANGSSGLRSRYQKPLFAITGVVALVLLIACGNIANLQLARAVARRHEMSVRQALGASRTRLIRQLLSESLLLGAIGGALGIAIAAWASRVLVAQLSTATNRVYLQMPLDWRILGFTAAIAIGTALLFGTAPALRASGVEPIEAIREQGRGGSGTRASLAGSLVVVQVALSLVLLVAAGLFVRTFSALATLPMGFEKAGVLVAQIGAQRTGVDSAGRPGFYDRMRQSALALPGVRSAALSVVTPVSGSAWGSGVQVVGEKELPEEKAGVNVNYVSPQWFATFHTTLIAGRDFTDRDVLSAPGVAIVNQTLVRQRFGGKNPIGRVLREPPWRAGDPARDYEIVGVAEDAVYRSLRDTIPATVYLPLTQNASLPSSITLSVRTAAAPGPLTRPLTAALAGIDRNLSVTYRTLADQVDASLTQERLVAVLATFFGGLALLLAGIGLYGVASYSVNRRRTEMGIRMALGAQPTGVMRLVMRRVAVQVGIGIAAGALVSWWAARFVASLLYGLAPQDPLTIVLAVAVLAGVGALAGWFPARRASRIDPAVVLRSD
jgi:predicted permease